MTDLQSLTERIEAVTTDSELLSVACELRNSVLNANLGQPMLGDRFSGPIQSLWKRAQSMDCPIVEPNTNYVQSHVLAQLNELIEWAKSKAKPVTPVPEKKPRTGRKKNADTDNGVRIIAAICKLHQYENCTVGNRVPGSLPEIAKLAGIPKTNKKAVSDFMKKHFGSHAEYKEACKTDKFDLKLAQWQGELIPHVQRLFDTDGAIPDPSADD